MYVDNDPVVAAHYRSVCNGDRGLAFIESDIRATQDILSHWELEQTIDLAAPVAFLCAAVLHFVPDEDRPNGIVAALRWRMAETLARIADIGRETSSRPIPRTAREISDLFTGLDLIEPGLTDVSQWRPDEQTKATKVRFLGGVGRKS